MSKEALQGFYKGIFTDISMASYFALPSFLLWIISVFWRKPTKMLRRISLIVNMITLLFVSLLELSSISLFKEWGTTYNARAFNFMLHSSDTFQTVQSFLTFQDVVVLLAAMVIGYWMLAKIHRLFQTYINRILPKVLLALLYPLALVLGARGGIDNIPISPSSAFYSTKQANNYLAVNKSLYFTNTLKKQYQLDIDQKIYKPQDLSFFYRKMYQTKQKTDTILTTSHPNIVLILFEGCLADVFEPLDGIPGLTPNFTQFSKEGLLFTRMYSSGFRTDQGVLSAMSGIPATPYFNILNDIELTNHFPSVFNDLDKNGYETLFMYGGNISSSNFKNYCLHNNTHKIIGKSSFAFKDRKIAWGASDKTLFKRANIELNQLKQPFFSLILTQQTHPPFDMDDEYKFGKNDTPSKFKSTVYSMDKALGQFIEKSKQEVWYNNTLFVIMSDHGSLYLGNRYFNDHRRFQIPLLFFGPALKANLKGTTNHQIGNHFDFPATLLTMLHLPTKEFVFSRNLLAPNPDSPAYWITEHTEGWITQQQDIVINHETEEIYHHRLENFDNTPLEKDAMMFYKIVADYVLKQKKPSE